MPTVLSPLMSDTLSAPLDVPCAHAGGPVRRRPMPRLFPLAMLLGAVAVGTAALLVLWQWAPAGAGWTAVLAMAGPTLGALLGQLGAAAIDWDAVFPMC